MTSGKIKGSSFERVICKQLSLWWSKGKRDDIFWRTSGSGARAKVRSKKNKKTFGQYGDIQAADPIGQPLIDFCTIEIKVGYTRQTVFDLVDALPSETKQTYKKFIEQARKDNGDSNCSWWVLITKRRYKETLIIMPLGLFKDLKIHSNIYRARPSFRMFLPINEQKWYIYGTTLSEFFKWVKPEDIERCLEADGEDD
jgi:hypothetical protein